MTTRTQLVSAGNVLLGIFYVLGALVILFPMEPTIIPIPQEFGYLSVGYLLLSTGIFGSPYYTEIPEEKTGEL